MATGSYHAFSLSSQLRAARSLLFFLIYAAYVLCVMVPLQWFVISPLVAVLPSRRQHLIGGWLRLQAGTILVLARALAGLRISVEGIIAPTSCIVVMNHQSLLDIPLGISLMKGPYPLIPTRARYGRGIPGISRLIRLARYPLVSQGRVASREELLSLKSAADEVARGDQSFLIFPEGHRTLTGQIGPFMSAGLGLVLSRARQRPVYVVVVDGMSHLRTSADTAFRLAGSRVRVVIRGPYTIPPDPVEIGKFMQRLRETMIDTLSPGPPAPNPPERAASRHVVR